MTKKHFEAAARLIETAGDDQDESLQARQFAAHVFALVAEETNPRFDRARFLKACGLGDE